MCRQLDAMEFDGVVKRTAVRCDPNRIKVCMMRDAWRRGLAVAVACDFGSRVQRMTVGKFWRDHEYINHKIVQTHF